MGVPKRKVSRARRDSRATPNMAIEKKSVAACQTCQAPISSHKVCQSCGYYKGKKILTTKADRMHKRNASARSKQSKTAKTASSDSSNES